MKHWLPAILIAAALASCTGNAATSESPLPDAAAGPSYELDKPLKTYTLRADLLEVSGIAYAGSDRLLAIEDATRNVYVLDLANGASVRHKAPFQTADQSKIDMEGIELVGKTAYAIRSNGVLLEIRNWEKEPEVRAIETGIPKDENIEGIAHDPETGHLLLASKERLGKGKGKKKGKSDTQTIYAYDLKKGALLPQPFLPITPEIAARMGKGKGGFHPSDIAVHPRSKEIYVLGSAGIRGLARFDRKGSLLDFSPISNALPQPEGLTFAPDGTLFISTEGVGNRPAQLMSFRQQ